MTEEQEERVVEAQCIYCGRQCMNQLAAATHEVGCEDNPDNRTDVEEDEPTPDD